MKPSGLVTARVGMWLAREARPVMRVLKLDGDAIATLQRGRTRWVLERAFAVPFYRRRMEEEGLAFADLSRAPADVLGALPPVAKAELRSAGTAVLSGGEVDPSWHSSRSSGSTGEPFRVYYDPRAWAVLKYLVKWRGRAACGVRATDKLALMDAIPGKARPRSPLERAGRVRRVNVLRDRHRIGAELLEFSPDVLYGLPSALCEIADGIADLGGDLRPRRVFTSGELLVRSRRERLAEAFGCPVLDVYGTSETKEIAFECLAGSLHVNADVVLVEVLDERGSRCDIGVEGDIVATSLVNAAMPLIRFRTGDRGRLLPGSCSCGLSLGRLGVVTGRAADMLRLAGGGRLSPYALTSAIEVVPGIARYQVVQTTESTLLVNVIPESHAVPREIENGIRAAVSAATGGRAASRVRFVEELPKGPGGKVRVVLGMSDRDDEAVEPK